MTPYINLGTEKCCFYCVASIFLFKKLEKYPLLYFAIEEALLSSKKGHYAVGILTFSQLLNFFNQKTPKERHNVAHKILEKRPSEKVYEDLKEKCKKSAKIMYENELRKSTDFEKYQKELLILWERLQNMLSI